MLIWDIMERAARQTPERIALRAGEREITYAGLAQDVQRLAAGFAGLGLGPGERVAMLLPNTVEMITALLAAFRQELVVVPLAPGAAPPFNGSLMSDASARAVISTAALIGGIPQDARERLAAVVLTEGDSPGCVPYEDLLAGPAGDLAASGASGCDPIGLIIFTSGTTGRPKGVAHGQARLVARAGNFIEAVSLTAEDNTLLAFSAARPACLVTQLLAMLKVGGTVNLADSPDSDLFWRIYAQAKPTYSVIMPAYTRRIFEDPAAALADHSRVRFWITTGDQPSPKLCRKVEIITGSPLLNAYGMTEVGLICLHPLKGPRKPGSMGRPLKGVELRLADPQGREVEKGMSGRILVRTANWMVGYWNDTLRTHQALGNGWLDTKDMGRGDEDGYYWFLGRSSDMIVRNATIVATVLVKQALLEHPAVAEAVVVGLTDASAGQVPIAFYSLKPGASDPGTDTLRQLVSARVDGESIPAAFHLVEHWPVAPLGKIDKGSLVRTAQASWFHGKSGKME